MTELYRIPRLQVPAEVRLAGSKPRRLELFLGLCAQTHSGYERPSDLLNGRDRFLPAVEPGGQVIFLQRDAVHVVTVDAQHEFGPEDLLVETGGLATRMDIEVKLIGGDALRGEVRYVLPDGQRRLQDFLNQPGGPFFALRDGDRARLIHKHRVLCTREL